LASSRSSRCLAEVESGRHRWIADAIDDGLRLFAIVETVKTGWIFRWRATLVCTRIVVLDDGR
jgi:hypothetical protein